MKPNQSLKSKLISFVLRHADSQMIISKAVSPPRDPLKKPFTSGNCDQSSKSWRRLTQKANATESKRSLLPCCSSTWTLSKHYILCTSKTTKNRELMFWFDAWQPTSDISTLFRKEASFCFTSYWTTKRNSLKRSLRLRTKLIWKECRSQCWEELCLSFSKKDSRQMKVFLFWVTEIVPRLRPLESRVKKLGNPHTLPKSPFQKSLSSKSRLNNKKPISEKPCLWIKLSWPTWRCKSNKKSRNCSTWINKDSKPRKKWLKSKSSGLSSVCNLF